MYVGDEHDTKDGRWTLPHFETGGQLQAPVSAVCCSGFWLRQWMERLWTSKCWTGVACKYACKFPQDFSRILEITIKNHSPTLIPEGENLCRAKWLLLILLWVLGEQLWQRSKFCIGGLLNHKSTGIPLSINTDFFSQVWPSIVSKPIKEPI